MTGGNEQLRTDLAGVVILDSWRWDQYAVMDEVEKAREAYNAARRKQALMHRERKLQPPLLLTSAVGPHRRFKVTRYRVVNEEKGFFCAERQEELEGDV